MASLCTLYTLIYLKGKMCGLLHSLQALQNMELKSWSPCLLSHAEVVTVYHYCVLTVSKKKGAGTFLLLCMPCRAGKVRHH